MCHACLPVLNISPSIDLETHCYNNIRCTKSQGHFICTKSKTLLAEKRYMKRTRKQLKLKRNNPKLLKKVHEGQERNLNTASKKRCLSEEEESKTADKGA